MRARRSPRAPARRRPGEPRAAVRLPAVLAAVPRRARSSATGRCPSATWPSPTSGSAPARWDDLDIPVGLAFFFRSSLLGPGGRLLPGPGRGDGVDAAAGRLGRRRRRQPGAGGAAHRRRGAADPGRGPARRARSCRSTAATSWSAGCARSGGASTAGADARAALARSSSPTSRHAAARSPRGARRERARLRRPSTCCPTATPPPRPSRCGCGSSEPPAAPGPRPGAARARSCIEPQRRAYSDAEAARLLDLFGDRSRWSGTLRPFAVRAVLARHPGVHRGSGGGPRRCRAATTSRSARRGTCRRSTTATVPLLFLFSGTVFTRRRARTAGRAGAVARRGHPPHAGRRLAAAGRPALGRAAAGCGCRARRCGRCRSTARGSGRRPGRRPWPTCSPRGSPAP